MPNSVTIELSNDEALVLFELVTRLDTPEPTKLDAAEQAVLWKLEATLEKLLVEPLKGDYDRLLQEARDRISARAGGLRPSTGYG